MLFMCIMIKLEALAAYLFLSSIF